MAHNKKLTLSFCREIAKKRGGVCLSKQYINNKSKLHWQCQFGHKWFSNLSNIKNHNSWCPHCAENILLTINDCNYKASENSGKCLSTKYNGVFDKLQWQCKNGHKWFNTFSKIRRGQWCPKCHIFKTQKKLKALIKDILNTKIISNYRKFNWLRDKNNMEIDLWCPELKLAIEYDGEQHFMPVKFGGISDEQAIKNLKELKKRDKLKNKLIKKNKDKIKYFIRFNYAEVINKENVKLKLAKYITLY